MQVILLEKVDNLGALGDLVTVKAGYARNYLLPSGRTKSATPANIEEFEKRRAELEKQEAERLTAAQARADKLSQITAKIVAKVGTEGKLFGSIGNNDIAAACVEAGVSVEKREIRLPEGPIRNVGEFDVTVHLHSDVETTVKVVIEGEE